MAQEVVRLNIGGVHYCTTRSTLTRYPDSMLASMLDDSMPTTLDEQGYYFIDRDGTLFIHVLNFMRSSQLALPDDFKLLHPLMIEADFYQIQPLIDELSKLQRTKQLVQDLVRLNVGGVIYTTTRSTLTRYPDSMLGAMFSGAHPTSVDEEGQYFIDRDGSLFIYILNFLRLSELCVPDDFKRLPELVSEADFYQVKPLIKALSKLQAAKTEVAIEKPAVHNIVEIIEIVTFMAKCHIRSGEETTFDRRTIITGRKDVIIDRIPASLRRYASRDVCVLRDFTKLEILEDNVRPCLVDFLLSHGWDLISTDQSSSASDGVRTTVISMLFGQSA